MIYIYNGCHYFDNLIRFDNYDVFVQRYLNVTTFYTNSELYMMDKKYVTINLIG